MDEDYNAEIESLIQKANSLQSSSLESESTHEGTATVSKVSGILEKILNIMSQETREKILNYYSLYMLYVITWLGNIFLFIQLAEIIQNKDSSSVSMAAYSVLMVSSTSWFIYGFLLRDPVLLISGLIQMIGVIALLVVIPKYRKGKVESSAKKAPKNIKKKKEEDED